MTTERRQHPRKNPAQFTFIQLEQEFGGRVLNYSKEGLCFETSAPISNTDMVQFWLSYHWNGQINGVGKITWLNDKKNLGGMAFVHLSRASREKVDEWASAPEGEPAAIEQKSKAEESAKDMVAQIMQQVLAEKRKSPVAAPLPAKTMDVANAAGAVAAPAQEAKSTETRDSAAFVVVTPQPLITLDPGSISAATSVLPSEAEQADSSTSVVESTATSCPEKPVDSTIVEGASTAEVQELNSTESRDSVVPAEFPLDFAETLDFSASTGAAAANETTVEQARTSNVNAPSVADMPASPATLAPQQIGHAIADLHEEVREDRTRRWPISTPVSNAMPAEQAAKSWDVLRQDSPDEMRELAVLKQQYRHAGRSQFFRGTAIGIVICVAVAALVFRFWKPANPGSLAGGTDPAISVKPSIASGATVPPSALGSAPESNTAALSNASALSRKAQNVISPRKSPVGPVNVTAPVASPQASSSDAAPVLAQVSTDGPANAIPRPGSFADRGAPSAGANQPFFSVPEPSNSAGPLVDTGGGQGSATPGVELGSTPWTYHRRNIHGKPPVGGDVRPAELVSSVTPSYPEAARAQRISGEVVINALIDTQGNVRKVEAVSGPMLLRAAALRAAKMWKYKPALLDGKPIEVHETITMKFRAP